MAYKMKGFSSPIKQDENTIPNYLKREFGPGVPREEKTPTAKDSYGASKYGKHQKAALTTGYSASSYNEDKSTTQKTKKDVKTSKVKEAGKKFMETHGEYLFKLGATILTSKLASKKDSFASDPAANFAQMRIGSSPLTRTSPLKAFGHIKAIFGKDELHT